MRALSHVIASFLPQIEHVLFRARNLHKTNLAASRYDRHARFFGQVNLYTFLARLSPALE